MVRLTRIYTKTGDTGETSLGNGVRVPKYHVRIEAIGCIDEANAAIGSARAWMQEHDQNAAILSRIQNDLFDLGADICVPESSQVSYPPLRMTEAQIVWLEEDIDRMNAELTPLNSFVLPGGNELSARLHLARTMARRAERAVTHLASQEQINPHAARYINRLSDHLFVLSRYVNDKGRSDLLWVPGGAQATPPAGVK